MTKREHIEMIAGLYPADSQYLDTAETGRRLLLEAMERSGFSWRDLPEEVLREYAALCQWEERRPQTLRDGLKKSQTSFLKNTTNSTQ